MPTVLKINRFFFFSNEGNEPLHIHVEKDNCYAKYWLEIVELAKSYGFNAVEINSIRKMVVENKELFTRRWYESLIDFN